jgi:hypothetical protein
MSEVESCQITVWRCGSSRCSANHLSKETALKCPMRVKKAPHSSTASRHLLAELICHLIENDGYSQKQIADVLCRSPGNIRERYHMGKRNRRSPDNEYHFKHENE